MELAAINIIPTLKDDEMIIKLKKDSTLHVTKKSKNESDNEVGIANKYKVVCTNEWEEIKRI
jgi:hypothetical protein